MKSLLPIFIFTIIHTTGFSQLTNANQGLLRIEVAQHVNALRISKGLLALDFNNALQKAAKNQSDYIASIDELTHQQQNSRTATPMKRVRINGGKDFEITGENVLYSKTQKIPLSNKAIIRLAKEMFIAWKKSPGHYANMVNTEYTYGDFGFTIGARRNVVFAAQVFGKKGVRIPNQLSTNAFGLTKDENECDTAIGHLRNIVTSMGNGLYIEGDKVKYYYHDLPFLKTIISNPNDGIAVDVVRREQIACGQSNQLDFSPIYDGVLLKPVYKEELLANNTAKSDFRLISTVGIIPKNLRDKDLAVSFMLIKNNKYCTHVTPSKVPHKGYELRPIKPRLVNPRHIKLSYEGVVATQELNYDFNANVTTPIKYPKIKAFPFEVKTIKIKSFSSVEGDTLHNAYLHKERALAIKKHVLKIGKVKDSIIQVEVKENWDEMYFQLNYFFADDLATWSKTEIKDLLASDDNRLPWDSLLFSQRKSIATIHYYGKLEKTAGPKELALLNFRTGITSQNSDLANKAMYELYKIGGTQPYLMYEDDIFEALKKSPQTVQNAAALFSIIYQHDIYKTTTFIYNWMLRHEELSEGAKRNLLHLYTLTSLYLLDNWDISAKRLSNVIHPNKVDDLALEDIQKELMLNSHLSYIEYFGQINDGRNISRSFNFIANYIKSHKLKAEDEIDLVLFYNNWTMFQMTIDFLLPKFKKNTLNKEQIFILAQTMGHYSHKRPENLYAAVHKKAAKSNKLRWCQWLKEDFQILRNYKIKRLYCDVCE